MIVDATQEIALLQELRGNEIYYTYIIGRAVLYFNLNKKLILGVSINI